MQLIKLTNRIMKEIMFSFTCQRLNMNTIKSIYFKHRILYAGLKLTSTQHKLHHKSTIKAIQHLTALHTTDHNCVVMTTCINKGACLKSTFYFLLMSLQISRTTFLIYYGLSYQKGEQCISSHSLLYTHICQKFNQKPH